MSNLIKELQPGSYTFRILQIDNILLHYYNGYKVYCRGDCKLCAGVAYEYANLIAAFNLTNNQLENYILSNNVGTTIKNYQRNNGSITAYDLKFTLPDTDSINIETSHRGIFNGADAGEILSFKRKTNTISLFPKRCLEKIINGNIQNSIK